MIVDAFLLALSLHTRLSLRSEEGPAARALGYALLFLPLVGLLPGVCLMLLMLALPNGNAAAAGLLLAVRLLLAAPRDLAGAVRGLAVWAVPSRDADIRGQVGVVALVVLLLVQLSAYIDLLAAGAVLSVLVAPVLALTAVCALFYTTPAVGAGRAAALAQAMPRRELGRILLLVGVLIAVAVSPWPLLVAMAALVLLRWQLLRREGGIGDDAVPSVAFLVETTVLVAATF